MPRRRSTAVPPPSPIPARVDWSALTTVPPGETAYHLTLLDEQVELLARGICPEIVAQYAWEMLGWKREFYRVTARGLAEEEVHRD